MRGKTNATNGVHLNATAVNKTVKSGQITAGDFVEYYIEPNTIPQSAGSRFLCNIGDYTVTRKGTGIALFKGIVQVDEYLDYNVLCGCQYDDFVVFFSSSNIIGVLEIDTENDKFSLVDTISAELYSSSFDDDYTIGAGEGMILACTQYKTSNTRYRFALIDISAAGELSNCTVTNYITGNNYNHIHIDNYDGNFCMIGTLNSLFKYDSLVIAQNREISFGSNVDLRSYYMIEDKMLQHDQYVIYAGGSTYSYNARVACIDILEGTCNLLSVEGDPTTNIENGKFVTYDNSSAGIHILRLYSYDENTKEVTLLDTINPLSQPYPNMTTNARVGGFINGDDVLITVEDGLRRFKIHNNHIEEIPDIDYVVPYGGIGDPIGVAQTDGNTNDVIPIYVPTASI